MTFSTSDALLLGILALQAMQTWKTSRTVDAPMPFAPSSVLADLPTGQTTPDRFAVLDFELVNHAGVTRSWVHTTKYAVPPDDFTYGDVTYVRAPAQPRPAVTVYVEISHA